MSYDEQEYTKSFDIKIWKKVLPFLKPFRKVVLMVTVEFILFGGGYCTAIISKVCD